VDRIKKIFYERGYDLIIKKFHDLDFTKLEFKDTFILYQSSEDRGLHYKDYIEDVLLGLMMNGAILIPSFPLFRAHHNKVFMEILRNSIKLGGSYKIYSKCFGTYEEFKQDINNQPEILVMKPASGARSSGVKLKIGHSSQLRYARKLARTFNLLDYMKMIVNSFIKEEYRKKSLYRRKFVVQEFIPNLDEDFKILVYGEKYYVLERKVRKNDFRASGSGIFSYPLVPPSGLLDFANDIFSSFQVPFISLDIAKSNNRFILIEFQFLNFGNYTIEHSNFYFKKTDYVTWIKIEEIPDLEREIVESISRFLDNYHHSYDHNEYPK